MNGQYEINILCATDDNYAPYCGIMLTSLFDSNKDCRFNVYVFEDGSVSKANRVKYQRLGKRYGNEITILTIDDSMIRGFPMNAETYITLPTYYRILASELLPTEWQKVIYLDVDMIVCGDIKPLWDVDLTGKALAGVIDCSPWTGCVCERLGYPQSFGYFNAGLLALNLDYWRNNKIGERIVAYVSQYYSDLRYMDQDALNGVLYEEIVLLPARYNYSVLVFLNRFWEAYSEETQQYYLEEKNRVVVIHYQGEEKPWDPRHYGGPFLSVWEKQRKKSLWEKCRNLKPLHKYVKYLIKKNMFPDFYRKQIPNWMFLKENKIVCSHETVAENV